MIPESQKEGQGDECHVEWEPDRQIGNSEATLTSKWKSILKKKEDEKSTVPASSDGLPKGTEDSSKEQNLTFVRTKDLSCYQLVCLCVWYEFTEYCYG
jgi:hypothetical protein